MQAGYACTCITPEVGVPLDGFIARLHPSDGVDIPLMARALWLETPRQSVLFIGLDLLRLSSTTRDAWALALSQALNLPPSHIVFACSHTHAGPIATPMRGIGQPDPDYLSHVQSQVLAAASQARANKASVEMRFGRMPIQLGINRRQNVPGEGIILGRAPDKPCDEAVRFIEFSGGPRPIVLFLHAAHPYCIGSDSSLISPDFFGHAAARLDAHGYDALYLNGCAGDISPLRAFEGPDAALAEGNRLADAILTGIDGCTPLYDSDLHAASQAIELPLDQLPDVDELERQLNQPDKTVRDTERSSSAVRQRVAQAGRQWLTDLRDCLRDGPLPLPRARISVVRIGEVTLVTLPGEIFYETGRRIAERCDAQFVAAYCHSDVGYVPVPTAYEAGGYEVDEAHRYLGLWRVAPQASTIIEEKAIELCNTLRKIMS